ncbi:MAG: triose-phosphate isomerase [Pseudomonadota bacterium]
MRKPLVAGNWKMNGLKSALEEINLMEIAGDAVSDKVDVMICPPATLIQAVRQRVRRTTVGAQDCHVKESGAHTGDLSAEMLVDAGASAIIVGHSERRQDHGETDDLVRAKASAAIRAGALAIICVGETREIREAGRAEEVVLSQVAGSLPREAGANDIVIAYEPVWAIGTGLTPTPDDVADMHSAIRTHLLNHYGTTGENVRIVYGGSVKPGNAAELMAVDHVDGALVGGASLKADDFAAIFSVYRDIA